MIGDWWPGGLRCLGPVGRAEPHFLAALLHRLPRDVLHQIRLLVQPTTRSTCNASTSSAAPWSTTTFFVDAGARFAGPVAEHHTATPCEQQRQPVELRRHGAEARPGWAARRRDPRQRAQVHRVDASRVQLRRLLQRSAGAAHHDPQEAVRPARRDDGVAAVVRQASAPTSSGAGPLDHGRPGVGPPGSRVSTGRRRGNSEGAHARWTS